MSKEFGLWEIAVLAMLRESAMHPYQMQRLLRVRHKDEILLLKKGSLYHAIGRLLRDGLIAIESTSRAGKRPERTTYRITPEGQRAFAHALRGMVATPRREPSEFMAALSFLVYLRPEEAVARLEERCRSLQAAVDELAVGLRAAAEHVERINLIESEYLQAMQKTELAWVRRLREQIVRGELQWDLKAILKSARSESRQAQEV